MLFVCNLKLTSGKDALEGDFVGDAEERLTGLLVGDGAGSIRAREEGPRLRSIVVEREAVRER